jgi:pilus assembly protein Flp/PilA
MSCVLDLPTPEYPRMYNVIGRFLREESGATALEYTFIASLIALGIIGTVTLIGTKVSSHFSNLETGFN